MASDGMGPKSSDPGYPLGPEAIGDVTDETAVSVIELTGAIKWFDVSKGYGFIIPDNGLPDVLLHVTCLRRDGFQTAYEGARVVCEVLQRPKGLQAFRILSMDESTAVHPTLRAGLPAAALILLVLSPSGPTLAAEEQTVEIVTRGGVHTFTVEFAETDEERTRGLMFRKELPEGRGMMFDFKQDMNVTM